MTRGVIALSLLKPKFHDQIQNVLDLIQLWGADVPQEYMQLMGVTEQVNICAVLTLILNVKLLLGYIPYQEVRTWMQIGAQAERPNPAKWLKQTRQTNK